MGLFDRKGKASDNVSPNSPEDQKIVLAFQTAYDKAYAVRNGSFKDIDKKHGAIDTIWEDEYMMYKGRQWDTSFAYRSKQARKTRPNSVDNFIFPMIINQVSTIVVNKPEIVIHGVEDTDDEVAKELTKICQFNDKRNKFYGTTWKKMVQDFISYGPIIGEVVWDPEWTGGYGDRRWIGDIRKNRIDRRDFFPDPAIINLDEELQDCKFIVRRKRIAIETLQEKYPDKASYIEEDPNNNELQDEGADPQEVYLYEYWYKGFAEDIDSERSKELKEQAEALQAEGEEYHAKDKLDASKGELKGVHVAYIANSVVLERRFYEYDDCKYPFVYKELYYDENEQMGFGEIRNVMIPQVMHNKADEIEIEAMSREGLGGMFYNEGAMSPRQRETIINNNSKGGMMFEVKNIQQLKEREGVKVPSSIINYKEHKQRMVETISQNTAIQQGISPGANIPYRTIRELGARTDVRTKAKVEILEDFLSEMEGLRISRIVQFYTEDRYYRITGPTGQQESGSFNANMLYRKWDREEYTDPETGEIKTKQEKFVPDFDITIKVMDERPTDREYYTSTAFELLGANAMTIPDLWYTLDEGKFPPRDTVIDNLAAQNMGVQLAEQLQQLPPEAREAFIQAQQQLFEQMMQQGQGQDQQQGVSVDQFVQMLPDDILQVVMQLPQDQQDQMISEVMQLQPQDLEEYLLQLRSQI